MSQPPADFVRRIFDPYTPASGLSVPLNNYQEFTIRRFRIDREFDTRTDRGRLRALMWYLEAYGPLRQPLPTPFSADQLRWMLEPSEPFLSDRPLPRIVEAFWRRSVDRFQDVSSAEGYAEVCYWWCAELVPHFGVEDVLVPDIMIRALSAERRREKYPATAFLEHLIKRDESRGWRTETPTERLACYVGILVGRHGRYFSLFFPKPVLEDLAALGAKPADQPLLRLTSGEIQAVRRSALEALEYRGEHARFRQRTSDVSAALSGRTWSLLQAKPAPVRQGAARPPIEAVVNADIGRLVRVVGPINSQSGLGQAARMSIEALRSVGVDPLLLEFDMDNPAPRVRFYENSADPMPKGVINLLHLNAESIPLAAAFLDPKLFVDAYNIGYFFWELSRPARCHELALELLDETWVSSEFNRQGYAALTQKSVCKVGMAVEALPEVGDRRSEVRRRYDLPEDAFVFMATFDGFSFLQRKNPQCVLRAFLAAFGDRPDANVRMILKTHNLSGVLGEPKARALADEMMALAGSDPRIISLDKTLAYDELLALKIACDAYVSLHRSEGWGFGALEAMQLGLPVIATAFSGNLEFCTPETSYLVPYAPAFLAPDDYIFVQPGDQWAEPDVQAAAATMLEVWSDPAAALARGAAGRAFVQAHFSSQAVGTRYLARLREIGAERGFRTQAQAPSGAKLESARALR